MTVTEVFKAAGLRPSGPVSWLDPIAEAKPGVYVIALVSDPDTGCDPIGVGVLPSEVVTLWVPLQPIVYIGRTKRALSRRINEFYRHKHGQRSPHRGGQDVKLLACTLWVYWGVTEDPSSAEEKMIEAFKGRVGKLPFANRVRSARVTQVATDLA